jgi:predicted lipoprotein with Yx(FWY)xxD motif
MSRWTAYRQVGLVGALGTLVWAACTPVGPATDIDPTPTPAAPVVTPSPTATPAAATPAAATSTPLVIDYDYDYGDLPAASPSPAEPDESDGEAFIGIAQDGGGEGYLVGPNGHALYIFTQDGAGVSNCTGACADAWPPLTVGEDEVPSGGDGVSGEVDVIERDDGGTQVTYDGAPLYYYTADQAPGDTAGEGVGGVWFLARP